MVWRACLPRRTHQSGGVLVVGALVGMGLYLSGDPEVDDFLDADPLALLVGMVLDQQVSERTSGMARSVSS